MNKEILIILESMHNMLQNLDKRLKKGEGYVNAEQHEFTNQRLIVENMLKQLKDSQQ